MRFLILIGIVFTTISLSGQSAESLLRKLEEAESRKEKTILNYKIGEVLRRQGSRKTDEARKYAEAAFELASREPRDYQMLAQIAMLKGQLYAMERSGRAKALADREFKNAGQYAQTANDLGIFSEATKERAELKKDARNDRAVWMIYEDAFEVLEKKSISRLGNDYEEAKARLGRERRELEKERAALEAELKALNGQIDQIKSEKDNLEQTNQKLAFSNQQKNQQLSRINEELDTITKEKAKVEEKVKTTQEELEAQEKKINEMTEAQAKAALVISEEKNKRMEIEQESLKIKNRNQLLIGGVAIALLLALLIYGRYWASRRAKRVLEEKNRQIEYERERSDDLLRNILPAAIAEELKEKGKASARNYKEATVLFSDFKNFTKISEKLTPSELVLELDKCFKAFDFIIDQYPDIEKIKTIGDAYMCASGLSKRKTLPTNMVRAALEMQEHLEQYKRDRMRAGKPYFEARIGIHTGPVTAGVVGMKKFAYDIWGDTVNIASRMESESEGGRVNISNDTFRLIQYQFDCEYRGKIPAKNKGHIDMYFVKKEREAVAV